MQPPFEEARFDQELLQVDAAEVLASARPASKASHMDSTRRPWGSATV